MQVWTEGDTDKQLEKEHWALEKQHCQSHKLDVIFSITPMIHYQRWQQL